MRRTTLGILRFAVMVVATIILPSMLFAQEGTSPEEKSKKRKKKEVVAIADFTQGFSVRGGNKIMPVVRTPEQDSLEVVELSRLIDSLVVARENLLPEDSLTMATTSVRIDSLVARRTTLLPTDSIAERLDTIATDTVKKER